MPRRDSPFVWSEIPAFLFVCFVTFLFWNQQTEVLVPPDGREYLDISHKILSGIYFGGESFEELNFSASSFRVPLYPVLLAIQLWLGGDPSTQVTSLHIVIGLLGATGLAILLRPLLPMWLSMLSVLLLSPLAFPFFQSVVCEWTGVFLLLLLYGVLIRLCLKPNQILSICLGLIAAALTLLKPVFVVPLGFLFLFRIFRFQKVGKGLCYEIAFFLAPCLLWSLFNYSRQGYFGLAPFGGYNLFGPASLVGHAEIKERDDEVLRDFIRFANQQKTPKPGAEDLWLERLPENYRTEPGNKNLFSVARKFQELQGVSQLELNRIGGIYARRAIFSNLRGYASFLGEGLKWAMTGILVALLCLGLSMSWFGRKSCCSIGLATAAGFHIVTIVFSSGAGLWTPRYDLQTFAPLVTIGAITIVSVFFNRNYKSSVRS